MIKSEKKYIGKKSFARKLEIPTRRNEARND